MNFGYVFFAITVLIQPIGQLLQKIGMNQIGTINSIGHLLSPSTIATLISNPYVVGGFFLSAIGFVSWLGAMSSLNISNIYPFGSIAYIILTLLAFFVLKENITVNNWIGICVIVSGCVLLNR